MSLTLQNIESELSYAYLHAIAGKAGMSCKIGDRHDDNFGVDAEVNFRGITGHPYIKHIQLNIQLKATIATPTKKDGFISYFLQGIERYNKLRTNDSTIYKILVVLFLPEDVEAWLNCSHEQLVLKNSAYWTCLYGAEESTNSSGQTVFFPQENLLDPNGLIELANLAAHKTVPSYKRPS